MISERVGLHGTCASLASRPSIARASDRRQVASWVYNRAALPLARRRLQQLARSGSPP